MLETITVHCGTFKTGSTAIQDTLFDGSSDLTAAGILYPRLTRQTNHTQLLLADVRDDEIRGAFGRHTPEGRERSHEDSVKLWSTLQQQIESEQPKHLLLSSEYLFYLSNESLRGFVGHLRRYCQEVRGLVYLRDPVGYYISQSQQVIKYGAHLPNPSESLLYRQGIERLSTAFDGQLRIAVFDRSSLLEGDVITDLLSTVCDRPSELRLKLPDLVRNVSLSAEAMTILQKFNGDVWGDVRISGNAENVALLNAIKRAEALGDYPRPLLLPWAINSVLEANDKDIAWLSEKHEIDFPIYPAPEKEKFFNSRDLGVPERITVESVFRIRHDLASKLLSTTLLLLSKGERARVSAEDSLAKLKMDHTALEAKADEQTKAIERLKKSGETLRTKVEAMVSEARAASARSDTLVRENEKLKKGSSRQVRKTKRVRSTAYLLALPWVLLTLPISLPAILYAMHRKKRKKATKRLSKPKPLVSSVTEEKRPSIDARSRQNAPVLIWCPISVSGLTTQLGQLTAILSKVGIRYNISYHASPEIDHPEAQHWITPSLIDRPKVVFYMERYVPFERGFEEAFHVFYVNLDWLKPEAIASARVFADLVLCPVRHRLDEMKSIFSNAKVLHLPWPPAVEVDQSRRNARADHLQEVQPIRVLYVGNDYDEKSRKSPFATVEAILSCDRTDLVFDLKFRTPLPDIVKKQLLARPNVDRLVDAAVSPEEVEKLYLEADVNLIPNACEGNGLSIIESFAKGVVPAVLDGFPMKDVVSEENGYLIACKEVGTKEYATVYETTTEAILEFLNRLQARGVANRRASILSSKDALKGRQAELESVVNGVLASAGLVDPCKLPEEMRAPPEPAKIEGKMEQDDIRPLLSRPAFDVFREPTLIDIHITTSRRADLFRPTVLHLFKAIDESPYEHRLFLSVDNMDLATSNTVHEFAHRFDEVLWTGTQMGLPYLWNSIIDRSRSTIVRTERRPDFICYVQDDCIIQRPESYFREMVQATAILAPGRLGFVSGYHSSVHCGFTTIETDSASYILSDSIDGKNFMARPKLLYSVGKLTWWFPDGMRRGNPGPVRGSHFDLWQWKESPNSLMRQKRINIIVPGLCEHTAPSKEQSTWGNDTTQEAIERRISEGRIYATR